MATIYIEWVAGYGWSVYQGSIPERRWCVVDGFRGADLGHILSWCGDRAVTFMPARGR